MKHSFDSGFNNLVGLFSGLLTTLLTALAANASERAAWDGGAIPIRPGGSGYKFVDAFPGLPPFYAVSLAVPPGETNRIVTVGMAGASWEVSPLSPPNYRPFLDLSAKTFFASESGLVGMAFHPGFQTNGYVFAYYSFKQTLGGVQTFENRLSRFTVRPGGTGVPDPDSELVLFSQSDPGDTHNGGCLQFGPDGYLYLSVGDGSVFGSISQTITQGFFGGILRIDVDRRPGNLAPNPGFGVDPSAYSIPADNPFIGRTRYLLGSYPVWTDLAPTILRTEFYAIGMRNPWQFSFDPSTGELWSNDVGNDSREEVNRIVSGGNYGWFWREGTLNRFDFEPEGTIDPAFEYTHSSGRIAITGSRFYRGTNYTSLDGTYLFCDYNGDVGSIRPNGTNGVEAKWIANVPNVYSFATDPRDGSLLLTPGQSGKIERMVEETTAGQPWPELLSQAGVFENLTTLAPRPGLEPYEVNSPFWSDYAIKRRWFAVPQGSRIRFDRTGSWSFPVGTVWVKHFDRPYERPDRQLSRLETRILVRTADGVSGATYRWNEEGTEAVLVPPDGSSARYLTVDNGVLVNQYWRFPSRAECLRCHSMATGGPAGFNTAQLNRTVSRGGNLVSQIDSWAEAGYFENSPTNTAVMPRSTPKEDTTVSIERRVRSYFDSNCANCHNPAVVSRATWDARASVPLEQMGLIGAQEKVPFGDSPLSIVEPGSPEKSSLFLRISALGAHHMPPLATFELDNAGISLVRTWIRDVLPTRERFSSWVTNAIPAGTAAQRAKEADPDADGLSNYEEYLLREDPGDARLRWSVSIVREAGQVKVSFPVLAGRKFEVESTDRIDGVPIWSRHEDLANDPRVVDSDGVRTIPLPDVEARFLRVRVSEE